MKEKGFSTILLLIVVFIFAGVLISGSCYLGTLKNQPSVSSKSESQTQNQITASEIVQSSLPSSSTEASKQNINPTSNWKIYSDQKQKYSLKYPDTWIFEDRGGSDSETLSSITFKSPQVELEVVVSKRSYDEEIEIAGNNIGGEPKQRVVSEIEGKEFGPMEILGGKEARVVIIPGNKVFRFSLYGKGLSKYDQEFNQILSTFKFTL